MQSTTESVTQAVVNEACHVFDHCIAKIRHCLDQLTEEQVWWRPREEMNSIGNLILHLTGNVGQWIGNGLGGESDRRNRPAEFSERGQISKTVLLRRLETTVAKAEESLRHATAEVMLSKRRIQGFDVTGWGAVFDCVPHFKGHTQEIVSLTRMQLGSIAHRSQFHRPRFLCPTSPASCRKSMPAILRRPSHFTGMMKLVH